MSGQEPQNRMTVSYIHIDSLYKDQRILLFKRCWALEKVHGTSAHVAFMAHVAEDHRLRFASGGAPHAEFAALFDHATLRARFRGLGYGAVTVYGEAYGGVQQGMRDTYGPDLRFIVFDVKADERWLSVPEMAQVARHLGLEHVPYEEVPVYIDDLDYARDKPSEVAAWRLGPGAGPRRREGVVLRPLVEFVGADGRRVIAKHKIEEYSERATPQKVVDPAQLKVLADAQAIALEWVTPMRLEHVLDRLIADKTFDASPITASGIRATPKVIEAMIADVLREAAGEIVDSKEARAAIGRRTSELFKARLAASKP